MDRLLWTFIYLSQKNKNLTHRRSALVNFTTELDYYFPPIFIICKENHSFKAVRFTCKLSGQNAQIPKLKNWKECDWSSKVSKIRTKVIFLGGKVGFFFQLIFSKIGKGGKFAVQCVSNDIISWKCFFFNFIVRFFSQKNRKFLKFKITKFDQERVFFVQGIFTKTKGQKIFRG